MNKLIISIFTLLMVAVGAVAQTAHCDRYGDR